MTKKAPLRIVTGCVVAAGLVLAAGASAKTLGVLLAVSPNGVTGARYMTCNGGFPTNTVIYAEARGFNVPPGTFGSFVTCTATVQAQSVWTFNSGCPSNSNWQQPRMRDTAGTIYSAANPAQSWTSITFNQNFFNTHREGFGNCTNTQNVAFSQGS
jgi:hypothetical protein